ncbi:hypothetical protein [Vibrio coralliilyticus]|uniref:hypothetical protein n=1 Tax=Vibrio coralliilyticus TaxID=190893 RepID=UPI0002DBF40E|nr:hypothetical protein [Vibrio coralliilyticus]
MTLNRLPPPVTIVLSTLAWLLLASATGIWVPHDSKSYSSLMTLVGTSASVYALIFSAYQHISASKNTNNESHANRKDLAIETIKSAMFPIALILLFTAAVVLLVSAKENNADLGNSILRKVVMLERDAAWSTAYGTWLAALGTISTLFFVIYQNHQLRLEQKQERRERLLHESEQQKMWEQQQAVFSIQLYETHYERFEQLLNNIVMEHGGVYRFRSPTQLYKNLFPEHSMAKGVILKKRPNGFLQIIRNNLKSLSDISNKSETFPNYDDNSLAKEYLHNLSMCIACYLELEYSSKLSIGDIIDKNAIGRGPHKIINVFSPIVERHLSEILNHLSRFSNEDENTVYWFGTRNDKLQRALLSFAFFYESGSYITERGPLSDDITLLLECRDSISSLKDEYDLSSWLVMRLDMLFSSSYQDSHISEKLTTRELIGLYSDCHLALTEIVTDKDHQELNKGLAARLIVRLKQLGQSHPIDNLYIRGES